MTPLMKLELGVAIFMMVMMIGHSMVGGNRWENYRKQYLGLHQACLVFACTAFLYLAIQQVHACHP